MAENSSIVTYKSTNRPIRASARKNILQASVNVFSEIRYFTRQKQSFLTTAAFIIVVQNIYFIYAGCTAN